ncbi:MAG: CDP-glucose 4,6-dehydratase [Burkholderiales bacterium]|nr:CDP-glucose 4,6-dehydratase [Phycisphaerae bacterium]
MVGILHNAFRGKRVFLTGHTGFKGSWLVVMLDMLGAKTTGYALAPETTPSHYEKIGGDDLCHSVIGDLRDREKLRHAIRQARPDYLIHMGAQSLVRRSYRDPVDTFESNVTGTLNVLDGLRHYELPCNAVIITTDKVYAESGTGRPYVESDKLGGYDPYSTSKACCELVTESYRLSYFHPSKHAEHGKSVATARAGNVIGGGDWCEDRLIPDVVRAMAAGEKVRVRNPRAVRPWQHVLEPLTGYLLLLAHQARQPTMFGEGFNFGPLAEDTLEVEQVVQLALKAWGGGKYFCDVDPNAPHEAALLRLNSAKAHAHLKWRPRFDARTAITKTIEWYRKSDADPLAYSRGQIEHYFAL